MKSLVSLALHSFTLSSLDVMQFNAIACQCDDYWTLNNLSLFRFIASFFFSWFCFIFYFIFLLQWMCVSTRTHNDDCSSISIIFYVACFFSYWKGKIFLSFSLTLLQNFLLITHNSRKKTPTHVHAMYQYSNLEFFHLYFLVHEEFYILVSCVRLKIYKKFLSILSVINFLFTFKTEPNHKSKIILLNLIHLCQQTIHISLKITFI